MPQYGRTWWGTQWLRALDRIDFSNRLPRGKSYANKGMVASIAIHENTITAKVKGSRPKPYDIKIIVPPFFDAEKKIVIDAIKNNPLVLSQLLNRQLPHELLTIAENNKIKIFPESWQDIKLNCSCPDWAVPCKHLAAVIYTIANEIDQNPFLVFNLHRFDMVNELSAQHIQLHNLQEEPFFSIQDCLADKTPISVKKNSTPVTPDFSLIENLLPTLPLLFTANPLFYNSDFKPVLQNHYKRHAKYQPVYLLNLKKEKKSLPQDFRYFDYVITISESAGFLCTARDSDGKFYPLTEIALFQLLATTESKHLSNYSSSFVLLYRCFRFLQYSCRKRCPASTLVQDRFKPFLHTMGTRKCKRQCKKGV